MKRLKLERGKEESNSTGGNHLCGHFLRGQAMEYLPRNFQSRRSDAISDRDILLTMPETTQALQTKLNDWLKDTDAQIPELDDRYQANRKKRQLNSEATEVMDSLEKVHEEYLEPNYTPDRYWWGSKPSVN